jgi:hypothetical protein
MEPFTITDFFDSYHPNKIASRRTSTSFRLGNSSWMTGLVLDSINSISTLGAPAYRRSRMDDLLENLIDRQFNIRNRQYSPTAFTDLVLLNEYLNNAGKNPRGSLDEWYSTPEAAVLRAAVLKDPANALHPYGKMTEAILFCSKSITNFSSKSKIHQRKLLFEQPFEVIKRLAKLVNKYKGSASLQSLSALLQSIRGELGIDQTDFMNGEQLMTGFLSLIFEAGLRAELSGKKTACLSAQTTAAIRDASFALDSQSIPFTVLLQEIEKVKDQLSFEAIAKFLPLLTSKSSWCSDAEAQFTLAKIFHNHGTFRSIEFINELVYEYILPAPNSKEWLSEGLDLEISANFTIPLAVGNRQSAIIASKSSTIQAIRSICQHNW